MILDIRTVKAIGNKHYSILMESIRKSIVGGTFAMLSPNQIIGDMSPPSSPPLISAPIILFTVSDNKSVTVSYIMSAANSSA